MNIEETTGESSTHACPEAGETWANSGAARCQRSSGRRGGIGWEEGGGQTLAFPGKEFGFGAT